MPAKKKALTKKGKDVEIHIKVENLEKAVRAGVCKHRSQKWKHSGTGFWGFGSALAIVLSYSQNSSILWAILHGIISWFYVIYRALLPYF